MYVCKVCKVCKVCNVCNVCLSVCMYVCMYVCMNACLHIYISKNVFIYIYIDDFHIMLYKVAFFPYTIVCRVQNCVQNCVFTFSKLYNKQQ